MKVPVIAIIGRSNVGKSTIFNKITKSRKAIVSDFSGVTRDRMYGECSIDNKRFVVVDTGGMFDVDSVIDNESLIQSKKALMEADLIFFVVDASVGLVPVDNEIAQEIRLLNKKLLIVANKCDNEESASNSSEFYSLALGDVAQVSAVHNRNIKGLIHLAVELLQEQGFFNKEDLAASEDIKSDFDNSFSDLPIRVSVVGRPNVGKSTLINTILDSDRLVTFNEAGTTRDSIEIPFSKNNQNYMLIDTAGVRRKKNISETLEKFSVIKSLQSIVDSNVVVLVVDADRGISDQDLSLLNYSIKNGRGMVIVVNKWDLLNSSSQDSFKEELHRRLKFIDYIKVHYISALKNIGIGKVLSSVSNVYRSSTTRISTSVVNSILKMALEEHQPPMVSGRRIKIKYAHAGGYNPPIIVIHGNQLDHLPISYKKFISNYYRDSLGLVGTPLEIVFQNSQNPYLSKNKSSNKVYKKVFKSG